MARPRQLQKRKWYLNEIAECKALHCSLSFSSSPGIWKPKVSWSINNPGVQLEREPLFWQPSKNNQAAYNRTTLTYVRRAFPLFPCPLSHCNFIDLLTEFTKIKNPCNQGAPHSPLQWITGTVIMSIKEEKKTSTLWRKNHFHFEITERDRLFYILLSFVSLSARCKRFYSLITFHKIIKNI